MDSSGVKLVGCLANMRSATGVAIYHSELDTPGATIGQIVAKVTRQVPINLDLVSLSGEIIEAGLGIGWSASSMRGRLPDTTKAL